MKCLYAEQDVINSCVNSLITDTTSNSSNLGDADPAVYSTREGEAVSHC
jgi:hypothetical protein